MTESAPETVVVYVTAPEDAAPDLAGRLVGAHLAACANLVSVRSVYRWQGEVQDDPETLLILKTTRDRLDALRAAVEAQHPYDVPEFLVLPVEAGHRPYLDWVADSVREPAP